MIFPELTRTGALEFFSGYGREIYNPQGIRYWTQQAKQHARIDATIGSAKGREHTVLPEGGTREITFCIPFIQSFFNNLDTEEIFPYTPEAGTPAFRKAWRAWILRRAGAETERLARQMHLPVLTPGITSAIGMCARMFLDPGESIILPHKRWENYDRILEANLQLSLEEFPLFQEGDFNLSGLEESIRRLWKTQENAVVLLNFPNNPTGYCPSTETGTRIVDRLTDLARETDSRKLTILFDDAYESYVYDSAATRLSLFYQMRPQTNLLPVKLDGVTKEMLWYGGRAGTITLAMPDSWLDGSADLIHEELDNKFNGMIRSSVSNSATVTQWVATKVLDQMDRLVEERNRTVQELAKRHEILRNELANLSTDLITVDPFQGGFFCFVNMRLNSGLRATQLATHLLEKHGVGTVPFEQGEVNGIRIAYCSVLAEDIPDLCRSLAKTLDELRPAGG